MSHCRASVKFSGESGQGINSIGELFSKALNETGYRIFAYREYPSLIKGGYASYQIDFCGKELNSSSRECNILLAFSDISLKKYLDSVSENGIIIYDTKETILSEEEELMLKNKNITSIFLDSTVIAKNSGGIEIMSNVVMLGFLWRIFSLDIDILVDVILDHFKNKNVDLDAEKKCILAGYNSPTYRPELSNKFELPKTELFKQPNYVLTGNDGIGLGSIASGVRAYYAYPMTPATSLLKFFGSNSEDTKILVKQAENEITAIQLAMGSMYMGTRALVGTSGGGFDLMIETVSCAGMSETPLVVLLSQRTGAATGVPTWTGAGDLYTAIKGGHGEFPRCVLSVSDAVSSYILIQDAFNIAEKYQIPVILLTEKQISESLFSVKSFPKDVVIERGLSDGEYRYKITESGVSPRWIPEKSSKPYIVNSDEHSEDGTSVEDSEYVIKMSDKRFQKLQTLQNDLPEPTLHGNKKAQAIFVGYGSSKNVILDVINKGHEIGYLHYEYLYPLKTSSLEKLISEEKRIVLIENNQTGQFGKLVKEEIGYDFKEKLLKYDGRPFFVEDILDFLKI